MNIANTEPDLVTNRKEQKRRRTNIVQGNKTKSENKVKLLYLTQHLRGIHIESSRDGE